MKHAKWLLLVAVGILMVLPGCKSMNPMVNVNPDVNIAATEWIGTWDLLAGKDQVKVGTVTMEWQYDWCDPSKTGNDRFVNLMLYIEFHADNGYTFSGDAQVDVSLEMPTTKGAPGQYNAFKARFQVTPYPGDQTRAYLIPVSWLEDVVGWSCGGYLWFKLHVAGNFGTAMAGEFVSTGSGPNAWFNRLGMTLDNPPEPPGEYCYETFWAGDNYQPPGGGEGKWYYWFQYQVGSHQGYENRAEQPMWAGQFYDCGTLYVWEADGDIHVQYNCDVGGTYKDGFEWTGMTQTHLYLGTAWPGGLNPGGFPYKHDPVPGAPAPTDIYHIDNTWDPGTWLYVFAHGEVQAVK